LPRQAHAGPEPLASSGLQRFRFATRQVCPSSH
jgi:hypothetical protein